MARDVQQPEIPRQPGGTVQAAGGLAREAQPRVKRSHSQDARANATGEPSAQGPGSGQLELRLEARPILVNGRVNAGVSFGQGTARGFRIHPSALPAGEFVGSAVLPRVEKHEKENPSWPR